MNFQVITRVWPPEYVTVSFAASVKTRPVVEQFVDAAVHVATEPYAESDSVPLAPVAEVHVAAFHETSLAAQVVARATDGVKSAALACTPIFKVSVAVGRTRSSMVTLAALAAVLVAISVTVNAIALGTVTLACSLTVAVNVLV